MLQFSSLAEVVAYCGENHLSISEAALRYTALVSDLEVEEILGQMGESLRVMKEAAEKGARADLRSRSGLSGGEAFKIRSRLDSGDALLGSLAGKVAEISLAVAGWSACMGRVVASPTAGSCGILPGCLLALQMERGVSDDALVRGLLNAAGIGLVIAKNASVSGAEGGCQAECGSAAAMAASALVEILGGSPEECTTAAAHALNSLMGLVCDPVAGLVEVPCVIRNASSSAIALLAADLSLAGIPTLIPVDEVILAMKAVGDALPASLRETSEGGIAASETAKRIETAVFPSPL